MSKPDVVWSGVTGAPILWTEADGYRQGPPTAYKPLEWVETQYGWKSGFLAFGPCTVAGAAILDRSGITLVSRFFPKEFALADGELFEIELTA